VRSSIAASHVNTLRVLGIQCPSRVVMTEFQTSKKLSSVSEAMPQNTDSAPKVLPRKIISASLNTTPAHFIHLHKVPGVVNAFSITKRKSENTTDSIVNII
jgi:hypothetical protein